MSRNRSIAIAGAFGYIGRHFLEAATNLGITTYILDPADPPDGLDWTKCTRMVTEADFYALDVDVFHLALHPQHRGLGIRQLLYREGTDPPTILIEKPMVSPKAGWRGCRDLWTLTRATQAHSETDTRRSPWLEVRRPFKTVR